MLSKYWVKYYERSTAYGKELGEIMKKYILYILTIIGIGFVSIYFDWEMVLINLRSMNLYILIIALSLQFLTMILLSLQWKYMVSWIQRNCRFMDAFRINAKGNIVDAITPGVKMGGELARLYEIKSRLDLSYGEATVVVGLQKTISLFSFLSLTIISLIWFYTTTGNHYKSYFNLFLSAVVVLALGLLVLLILCIKPNIIKKILYKFSLKPETIIKIENAFEQYSLSIGKLLENKLQFLIQILLGIFIWILFAFKMALVIKGFNMKLDLISIAAITYLTYIVGMIPLLPGSIGSFETSMVTLLVMKGIPVEKSIAISVVFRFVTFWFEFGLSFIMLILDKLRGYFVKDDGYAKGRI